MWSCLSMFFSMPRKGSVVWCCLVVDIPIPFLGFDILAEDPKGQHFSSTLISGKSCDIIKLQRNVFPGILPEVKCNSSVGFWEMTGGSLKPSQCLIPASRSPRRRLVWSELWRSSLLWIWHLTTFEETHGKIWVCEQVSAGQRADAMPLCSLEPVSNLSRKLTLWSGGGTLYSRTYVVWLNRKTEKAVSEMSPDP